MQLAYEGSVDSASRTDSVARTESAAERADESKVTLLRKMIKKYRCRLYSLLVLVAVQLLISVVQLLMTIKPVCDLGSLYISIGFLFWIKMALFDYRMLSFASTQWFRYDCFEKSAN